VIERFVTSVYGRELEGVRRRPEGGGGEREPNEILFKNRPMSQSQKPRQPLC
jgi:hypothetical protein